jgi:hypothetical protein
MNQATSTTTQPLRLQTETARGMLPLGLTIRDDPAELEALWAMSRQQRIDAMWACQLSLSQLCEWSSKRPREVPTLGREFAWLVMHTPEWAEPAERQDNVVRLPQRGAHRAAA